jgi:hypothetical protein
MWRVNMENEIQVEELPTKIDLELAKNQAEFAQKHIGEWNGKSNPKIDENHPSRNPTQWAKPSCKKCNGRGIDGIIKQSRDKNGNIFMGNQPRFCQCVISSYRKHMQKKDMPSPTPIPEKTLEQLLSNPALRERIQKLNDVIENIQDKIENLERIEAETCSHRIQKELMELRKKEIDLVGRWDNVVREHGIQQNELNSVDNKHHEQEKENEL